MMTKLLLLVLSTTLMAPPVDSFAASSLGSHRHAVAAKVSYYMGYGCMVDDLYDVCVCCLSLLWYLPCHSQLKLANIPTG